MILSPVKLTVTVFLCVPYSRENSGSGGWPKQLGHQQLRPVDIQTNGPQNEALWGPQDSPTGPRKQRHLHSNTKSFPWCPLCGQSEVSGVCCTSMVAVTQGKSWIEWEEGGEGRLEGGKEEMSQMESFCKAIVIGEQRTGNYTNSTDTKGIA